MNLRETPIFPPNGTRHTTQGYIVISRFDDLQDSKHVLYYYTSSLIAT